MKLKGLAKRADLAALSNAHLTAATLIFVGYTLPDRNHVERASPKILRCSEERP